MTPRMAAPVTNATPGPAPSMITPAAAAPSASPVLLAVLTQRLAVVAEQKNRHRVEPLHLFQSRQDAAHLRIGESNLPVVGMARVSAQVGLRWMVRAMRIVKVQPHKEWRAALLVEPC